MELTREVASAIGRPADLVRVRLCGHIIHMKAIQITIDEELLRRLDESAEVKREGRSAVLRRAAEEYLLRRQRAEVRERYRTAYGEGGGLGDEFADWEGQGIWPEE